MPNNSKNQKRIALILSGGGAHAAYQVGVLKAIAEILPNGSPIPFRIICGTSAGAINAATLACRADNFRAAVAQLLSVWENFRTQKVFRTEARAALGSGLSLLLSLIFGGLGRFTPKSLLDNSPLRNLLDEQLCFQNIQPWIEAGILHAFSITAASYNSGHSVTFYQGCDDIWPWQRTRRVGIPRPITLNHLMASCAIPLLFPATRIGYEYYGDGSMRQTAPLSPALRLGADHLLVIGVRNEKSDDKVPCRIIRPSFGQISGYILDTLFMDSLSTDIERLTRINRTLNHIPSENKRYIPQRRVDLFTVFPSQDIHPIVKRHIKDFPRSVRYLMRGIGAKNQNGLSLMSYLMFERAFCRELITLGYHDAIESRERLMCLLGVETSCDVSRETYQHDVSDVSRETYQHDVSDVSRETSLSSTES